MRIFQDLQAEFRDPHTRWLNASILLYFAVLPFNAFGIPLPSRLPVFGTSVKYTEVALLFVLIFFSHAVVTRRIRIRHAPVLYVLLVVNAVAQFVALPIAGDRALLIKVGIAVTRYSILVFLLVNALYSDRLIRAALMTMGLSCVVVVVATYARFFAPGTLPLIEYTAVVGRSTVHVLAYALIFFGSGLIYWYIRGRHARVTEVLLLVALLLWMHLVFLMFVKVAQIVLFALLFFLLLTLHARRWRAVSLLALFVGVLWFRWHIVDVQNTINAWRARSAARSVTLQAMPPERSRFPVDSEVVVAGFMDGYLRFQTLTSSLRVPAPAPTPAAPAPTPAIVVAPRVDYYGEGNRTRLNWVRSRTGDSMNIRKRAIAIGWVLGRTHFPTGIGPGQVRGGVLFDAAGEQVRREARVASPFPWKQYFFVDREVPVATTDKGIFNIFMNAWAETGLFGLAAIVGLLALVCGSSIVALWKMRRSPVVLPIVVLLPLFLALLLYHQTIYLWVHPWFWTALALTYAAARVAVDEQHQAPSTKFQTISKFQAPNGA